MKMQYNGQEVDLITGGYWPEGVTLLCGDGESRWEEYNNVVCLQCSRMLLKNGDSYGQHGFFRNFALLPAKQAPRRLTNREVAVLCRKGWDLLEGEWVFAHASYKKEYENDPTPQGVMLRAPNSDEWLEPTSELLEVEA